MTTVLVNPGELQATAAQLLRTSAEYAAIGARVVSLLADLPPATEVEVGPQAALLGVRLERLAGEVAAEAARQEAVAARTALADAAGLARWFIDTRTSAYWSRVIQVSRFAIQESWTLFGRVLPFYVNVVGLGYRVERRGNFIIARGERLHQPGLLRDWIRSGRLPGTRYLAGDARAAEELLAFAPGRGAEQAAVAAWQAVAHDAWAARGAGGTSLLRVGSGRVSTAFSLVPDAWDYSSLGPRRREGFASSGFVSAVATDLALSLAQVGASAAAGTVAGSVVPGAGNLVGFGVGLTIGLAVEFTPGGRGARNAVQRAVKTEIDDTITGSRELLRLAGEPLDPRPRPNGIANPWEIGRLGRTR